MRFCRAAQLSRGGDQRCRPRNRIWSRIRIRSRARIRSRIRNKSFRIHDPDWNWKFIVIIIILFTFKLCTYLRTNGSVSKKDVSQSSKTYTSWHKMIKEQDPDPHEGAKVDLDPHASDANQQPVLWIWIHMDPHWFGSPWSGSRRNKKNWPLTNKQDFQISKRLLYIVPAYCVGMFYGLLPIQSIFFM